MKITKIQQKLENYKKQEFYFKRARDAMYEFVCSMKETGQIQNVLLPAYIGWSPREGSGIFDPISNIADIKVTYYKMKKNLSIDKEDLFSKIKNQNTLVLIVNYFGFRDEEFDAVIEKIHEMKAYVLEDNAHGFFTYHTNKASNSDATFFSLHKMFPFEAGGSLIIQNTRLQELKVEGIPLGETKYNPYQYDIAKIADIRKHNFATLDALIREQGETNYIPLRKLEEIEKNVPQTYPILILNGNRDKIYEKMNEQGYGVVSLYHTLIEPLQMKCYEDSLYLAKRILNLPVHQDVEIQYYEPMVKLLTEYCQ